MPPAPASAAASDDRPAPFARGFGPDRARGALMVDVSREDPSDTEARLGRITARNWLAVWDRPHVFEEFPPEEFGDRADPNAMALVRDDAVWSQLVPGAEDATEPFAIWRFHFPGGVDNSGFVGWLAARLKRRFGTGVFVVCGSNSADGGIFDYWGCPWNLRAEVIGEVRSLVAGTSTDEAAKGGCGEA